MVCSTGEVKRMIEIINKFIEELPNDYKETVVDYIKSKVETWKVYPLNRADIERNYTTEQRGFFRIRVAPDHVL